MGSFRKSNISILDGPDSYFKSPFFQRWPTWARPPPGATCVGSLPPSLTLRWRRCWWSFDWFWWLPGPVPSPPQKLWRPSATRLPCWAIRHHPLTGGSFQVWQEGIFGNKKSGCFWETCFFWFSFWMKMQKWDMILERNGLRYFFSTFDKQHLKVSGIGVCHHNKHFKVHAA